MNARTVFCKLVEIVAGVLGMVIIATWLFSYCYFRPRGATNAVESLKTSEGRAERARVIRGVVASIIWKSPADTPSVYVLSGNPNDEEREWSRFGEREKIPGGKLAFADVVEDQENERGSVIFVALFRANKDGAFYGAPLVAKYTLTLIYKEGSWQLEKLSRNDTPSPTKKGGSPAVISTVGLLFLNKDFT